MMMMMMMMISGRPVPRGTTVRGVNFRRSGRAGGLRRRCFDAVRERRSHVAQRLRLDYYVLSHGSLISIVWRAARR